MMIEYLYNGANVFVLPFWLLMVIVPSWSVTRKVMASTLPFVPLALAYIYCFINSIDPESVESFANPTLSAIAALFADEKVMATGWIHFVVMDLFVGRWIYWQGQEKGDFYPALACFMSVCWADWVAMPFDNGAGAGAVVGARRSWGIGGGWLVAAIPTVTTFPANLLAIPHNVAL